MSTEPGSDPIGDLQRWLMRAGARSIGANVADRVKSTLGGGGSAKNADVWETATTEAPGDEPPECQWCPICRAARRYRDSGGTPAGAGSPLAGVGDTLAGFTRDAFGLFEAAMRPVPPRPPAGYYPTAGAQPASTPTTSTPPADTPPASAPSPGQPSDNGTVVGPGVGWPTVVHPKHEDDEATHEGGDREEGGERGNGAADGGADEQVERTAE
jgi:hypothetical protein